MKQYPIQGKTMKEKEGILLENVQEGFAKYPFFFVEGDSAGLKFFLEKCLVANADASYADFYYGQLTGEQQEHFRTGLSKEELEVLKDFETVKEEVFYALTWENLKFLSDITARGWLFSTFYFTAHPCTVWGNYDGKYPVFCKSAEEVALYRKLALEAGLAVM